MDVFMDIKRIKFIDIEILELSQSYINIFVSIHVDFKG